MRTYTSTQPIGWEGGAPASDWDAHAAGYAGYAADASLYPAEPQKASPVYALAGLAWGVMTGFSAYFAAGHSAAAFQIFQTSALFAAIVLLVMAAGGIGPIFASFTTRAGQLMNLHAVAAVVSSAITLENPIFMIRFLLLAVAFSMFIGVVRGGWSAINGVRLGLTLGGLSVVAFHLPHLTLAHLINPSARLVLYLNANSLGLMCALTGLSLFAYLIARRSGPGLAFRLAVVLPLLTVTLAVLVATKSRTAALAFLTGASGCLAVRTRVRVMVPLLLLIAIAATTLPFMSSFAGTVSDIYELQSKYRDMATLTGRLANWKFAMDTVWLAHPFFGGGPGITSEVVGVAHNGLLNMLCEVGIVGTLPVLCLIFMAGRSAIRNRRDPYYQFAAALLFGGFAESIAEPSMFSIGNPGSLLFLLSVAVLCTPRRASSSGIPTMPAGYAAPLGEGYDEESYERSYRAGERQGGHRNDRSF